jgi:hypothetical protein
MSERTARWSLALTLGLYLALGVTYTFVSPPFEAPDAWYHYRFIRDLIENGRLPVQELGKPKTESHQPPLYYVLGAMLTFWTDDDAGPPEQNPYWGYQAWRVGADNKRQYIRTEAEATPCRDRCLTVRILRIYSVTLGALAVLLGWLALREVFSNPAYVVGAAAFMALNPMFIYVSSAISNDNLITPLSMLTLWLALRAIRRGINTREAMLAGLVAGLAILTKVSGVLMIPLLGLAYGLAAWLRREWQQAVRGMALVAGIILLVSGWWFVRNLILYGELTGIQLMGKIWAERPDPDFLYALKELPYLWSTFWGRFGYGQIPLSNTIYNSLGVVVALAVMGLGKLVIRPPRWFDRETRGGVLVLVALFGFFLISTLNYMRISPVAAMGRFLFPALAAVGGGLFLGLAQYLPHRWVPPLAALVLIFMAGLATAALVGYVAPAYARPALLSPGEIASRTHSADIRFGDHSGGAIRLIGYDLDRAKLLPGDEVAVTLCWESLAPMGENYAYFVHVIGLEESKVGARDTHPGLSRYPTSWWTPGDAFCDVVRVPVETWAPAPAVYDVVIGWYAYEAGDIRAGGMEVEITEWLPAYDSNGTPLELVTLGKIKVAPEAYATVEVPNQLDADLDGQIALLGYNVEKQGVAPGQEVEVTLYWTAQVPVSTDYTVFVHLAAPEGPPYAQDDGQPQRGTYPTSFWDVGEVVVDSHTVLVPADLPSGDYPLVTGMYLLETGQRLRWLAPDGTVQGNSVPLVTLAVRPDVP